MMKMTLLCTLLAPLAGGAAQVSLLLKDGWHVEGPTLVREAGEILTLERLGEVSGEVWREVDVSGQEGQKFALRFEAAVSGGVTPWFEVRSLDGERSFVAGGTKMVATDLLTEHNRFGWYYDFRYGWPVNPDLPHLFRQEWQQVGGIFTVPEGVRRVAVRLRPRPVKYGLIDRRPQAPRHGEVRIRNLRLEPVQEVAMETAVWEKEQLDQDSFLYLSVVHNREQMALSRVQWTLWRLRRLAQDHGMPTAAAEWEALQSRLDQQRGALEGLAHYFHKRFADERNQLNLEAQLRKYPGSGGGALIDIGGQLPYYLSLHIQDLVDAGFELRSAAADALAAETRALEKAVADAQARLYPQLKAVEAPELAALSYLDKPAVLPADGKAPAILYATGNTVSPLRIYKELGVDLFSKNYPVSTFDETGLKEDPHLPAILERYGMRQISCLFTPVHGLFAVSEGFLKEHQGRWREFLRENEPGVAAIHARDFKTGKRDVLKVSMDEFTPEPGKAYILPINPLSPQGRRILEERMDLIRQHTHNPANQKVLAALELSAEPTGLIGVVTEPHTRAAYLKFLAKEAGDLEVLNAAYGTRLASLEALVDTPDKELPERLRAQRQRWERSFRVLGDAEVYHHLQARAGLPEMAFLHRNNDLYFSDQALERAQLKDSYVNYHAAWDRVYGYDMARALGRDHITGEDHPGLPTGLKDRHTASLAAANLLKSIWGYAKWGTKVIQLWRPYREVAYHSVTTADSAYTLLNPNWSFLPVMKDYTRRLGALLDAEVAPRRVAYLQLEGQGHVTWYVPSVYTTNQFLRRQQVPYAYLFEESLKQGKASLDDYDVLFVPPSLFVSQEMQERLLAWVEAGGKLVLFGPLGLHDERSLPSSWLMDRAFGPAKYRLVGEADQIRRPNQEGIWMIHWLREQAAHVQATPIAGADFPLPAPKAPLFEKRWNDFKDVTRIPATEKVDPAWMSDTLYTATVGKGKVILIPRELLPNAYGPALEAALGDLTSAQWAEADAPSFDVMRRRMGPDGAEFLIVQNEDEWQGRRTARISLSGAVEAVEDVSDLSHAVPVSTVEKAGSKVFSVTLEPGEIATFRLR